MSWHESVDCPYCGATGGNVCRKKNGDIAPTAHMWRVSAALDAEMQDEVHQHRRERIVREGRCQSGYVGNEVTWRCPCYAIDEDHCPIVVARTARADSGER